MCAADSDLVDLELECPPGGEYNEHVFLYFLGVESSRADRLKYPLQLLLVTVEPVLDTPIRMGRGIAARIFAGLRESVRETDLTGWYRQDLSAAAVLTACADSTGSESGRPIRQRVGEEIRKRLPPSTAVNLRLRVVDLRPSLVHR
jgi:hypothetical protein